MLKSKNPFYATVLFLDLILLLPAAGISVWVAAAQHSDLFLRLSSGFAVLSLLAAFYYVLRGFSKAQAWAYKAFVICYALSGVACLVAIAMNGSEADGMFQMIFNAMAFWPVVLMISGKDLGRTLSMFLSWIVVILSAASLITVLVQRADLAAGSDTDTLMIILNATSRLLLGITLLLATHAKYLDKALRGREVDH